MPALSHASAEAIVPLFGTDTARDALAAEADAVVARATSMITRMRLLVMGDRVTALSLIRARQVALATHLQHYQRFKHGRIFDPVVHHGTASSKVVARTMKLDCIALGDAFAANHTRWTGVVAAEWPAYRQEVPAELDTLLAHLKEELRAIRQLLLIARFYAV